METDLLSILPDSSLGDLCDLVKFSKRNIFPVVNIDDSLRGIITLEDIRDIMFDKEKQEAIQISQLMHSPPEVIFPHENMQNVMQKFKSSGAWNLPVVEDG